MPTILFPRLYNLVYRSAQSVFANRPQLLADRAVTTTEGTTWYRYVSYRNSMPQVEGAGRTQFVALPNDLTNRWTGRGPGGGGTQGLYLSQDFVNQGEPFPELNHYQGGAAEGTDLVPYYEYHAGGNPVVDPTMRVEHANNLRSMFNFTLAEDRRGLDLRLQVGNQANPLLDAIHQAMVADPEYAEIQAETQDRFDLGDLESIYQHPEGADFCRALGNAGLEHPDVQHLLVTSVRDGVSTNVVARTPVRADGNAPLERLDFLEPEGRATFFVDEAGARGRGVFSIPDMVYNTAFESPNTPPPELPSVNAFKQTLLHAQQVAIDELGNRLELDLALRPANVHMDAIVTRIVNVQDTLAADNYGETITAIGELQTAVATAAADPPTVGQFRASITLSTGVANTLSSMADAVRAAQERIDGMDPEPPDVIDDPDPDALEPEHFDPVDPVHGVG